LGIWGFGDLGIEVIQMHRALLIDNDPASSQTIADCLDHEGFTVISAHDGKEGLQLALAPDERYDLIMLYTLLPDMNGFELLQRIRSRLDTPVILLAAPDQRMLHVIGLELGADDFLIKPCNPGELRARVRAILRRTKNNLGEVLRYAHGTIVLGDIELDVGSHVVRRNGEKLHLTSAEFSFLEMLIRAAGHVVSREQLARRVLGRDLGPYDRSVDMHVSRLRKKLGHQYKGVERIITIRGVGFMYTVSNPFDV